MRDAIKKLGGDPESIIPTCPADLVIDQSLQVDLSRKLIVMVPGKSSNINNLFMDDKKINKNQITKSKSYINQSCCSNNITQNNDNNLNLNQNQILIESIYKKCPFHDIRTEWFLFKVNFFNYFVNW